MNGHIYEKNMLKLVKISYYLYGDGALVGLVMQ